MHSIVDRIHKRLSEEVLVLSGYLRSFRKQNSIEMTSPIDVVVTWVDGNDPAWQLEKAKYDGRGTSPLSQSNGVCRYRDWSFFRYWFRALEQYAPWVNKVFFVTWGHIPVWLDRGCPKLKIVRHTDFIPEEYLPTFSSRPIEFNLHRIPGLSEHFIYFNDDVFLSRPVNPTDFFINGKPVCCPVTFPLVPNVNQVHMHSRYSCLCMANSKNNIADSIRAHPELWFNHVNKRYFSIIKRALQESTLYGVYFSHVAVPFTISTFSKAWEKYPAINETCTHKFRTPMDAMHMLITIENLLEGNFFPVNPDYFGSIVNMLDYQQIFHLFEDKTSRMVCFTDSNDYTDEIEIQINRTLCEMFEQIFPNKSAFEK